ncbi:MAG: hypothetical protein ACOYMG_17615 [Candidatus Methylumidiphilus sp.]
MQDQTIDVLNYAAELMDAEAQARPSFELMLARIALNSVIQLRSMDIAQKRPMEKWFEQVGQYRFRRGGF